MASHVSNYLFKGARGRILLAATIVFLLVIFLSFHSELPDSETLKSTVTRYGGYVGRPESDRPSVPNTDPEPAQQPTGEHSSHDTKPLASTEDHKESASTSDKAPPKEEEEYELVAPAPPALQQLKNDDCEDFPDTSDVLLVMKTGATEAYDKLPIHFMSTLKCVQDFVLFSDMEMNMAGFHIRDVLKDLDQEFMDENPDFDLYRTLQDFLKEHQDPRDLKEGMNGWNLDKYKFVPMMKQAWDYRQGADWYVFMEADSFLQWDNLMQYLNTLDPKKPHYIGSPTYLDIQFAHGGTGYVISGAAMKKAVGAHPDLVEKYSEEAEDWCCGDRMTAKILVDENVRLTTAWPMFNGEKPLTLPFGHEQWCQPVMSMHHLTAQEVSKAWNFQMRRKQIGEKGPMLWKDVFDYFVKDNLRAVREEWENYSGDAMFTPNPELDFHGRKWDELTDIERSSPESPERCKALCQSDENCLQWQHHGAECQINFSIKLGKARTGEGAEKWVSGWNLARIQKFRTDMKNCPEVDWATHPPS